MDRIQATPLVAFAAFLATVALAPTAGAQAPYPSKAVRLIVPSSAGGGSDIIARFLAPKLGERLGQQVVVDNRPGAGTMIGSELVAKAPPDGYTLLMGISTLATNPVIYEKVSYNALTDFSPITLALAAPNILVVHPSLPVKTTKEVIALARSRPGALTYASAGAGTTSHLAGEVFKTMTKTNILHVPYKGNVPAITDLMSGETSMLFATLPTVLPQVQAGRLRGVAVLGAKRSAAIPQLPTLAESGVPGFEVNNWTGLLAPAGTPVAAVNRLNAEVNRIMKLPDVQARLPKEGLRFVEMTPQQFGDFVKSEKEKWAPIVKATGAKAD